MLDNTCTSVKKSVSKKKSVTVENDGSYLQAQASHSASVSTVPPSGQPDIVSTGQTILTMLSQIDASNKEFSW